MSFNKNTQKSSKSTLGFGNYGRYICSNGTSIAAVAELELQNFKLRTNEQ